MGMLRVALVTLAGTILVVGVAHAASCGNDAGGYERWKAEFSAEARARGISGSALTAFAHTQYSTRTIRADRSQRSFQLSLKQFMAKRGASAIIQQGRRHKANNRALLDAVERNYGVPPGPLVAIWGMETAFGSYMGNINILSSVATLAYDCRRREFFTNHLYAALRLVERSGYAMHISSSVRMLSRMSGPGRSLSFGALTTPKPRAGPPPTAER